MLKSNWRLSRIGESRNNDAVIVPQKAVFEVLNKRHVYIVDKDDMEHQREIGVQYELGDIYVLKSELGADETIIIEGVRQVRDGDKLEYDNRQTMEVAAKLRYHVDK